jgi:hypothetical protein
MSIELDKTRNDYTQDEVTEAVRERIQRRIRLKEEIDALSAYIFEAQDEDSDDLSSLKAALVEAEADLETATAQAQAARGGFDVAFKAVETAQPDLAEERANLAVKLATVDEEIREFLLRQEFAGRNASFALTLNGLQVTRTRTNKTKVSYDATPILRKFPELRDYKLDGDPLVEFTINDGIADRMLSDKTVSDDVKEALRAARTESFAKTPSVGIAPAKEGSDA